MTNITFSHPRCFDSPEQFKDWKDGARATGLSVLGYCADCTPAYKLKMLKQNRCGHPTVMFEMDSDGDLVGYIPKVERPEKRGRKVLKPDEQPSVKYLGPSSNWHPVLGTFARIPLPKTTSKKAHK